MTYQQFSRQLIQDGFDRVERDDRLLDIFPTETREKGVELWEKWLRLARLSSRSARGAKQEIKILRLHLPFSEKRMKLYSLPRVKIEMLLLSNETACLEAFERFSKPSLPDLPGGRQVGE